METKNKSKIHFNLPSLIGLICQIALIALWFTESIDYYFGVYICSYTPADFLDKYLGFLPAFYVNIGLLAISALVWLGRTLTTSRRGELYIPIIVSYIQLIAIAGFVLVYLPSENLSKIFIINGYAKAIFVVSFAIIILSHISYAVIKKYQKSLKEEKIPENPNA